MRSNSKSIVILICDLGLPLRSLYLSGLLHLPETFIPLGQSITKSANYFLLGRTSGFPERSFKIVQIHPFMSRSSLQN